MNRWITDRAPNEDEVDNRKMYWIVENGEVNQASGWWIKTSWGKRPELTAWEPKPTSEIERECEVIADTPGTYDACKAFIEAAGDYDKWRLAFEMAKEAVAKAEVNDE